MADRMLFAEEVAEVIGIKPAGVKQMLWEARQARKDPNPPAGLFPEPDDIVPRTVSNRHHQVTVSSPRWKAETVATWIENRPPNSRWNADRRAAVAAQLRALAA